MSSFTYDAAGLIVQMVEADSATSLPATRRSYTYTAAGVQTGTVAEKWTGSVWQNDSRALITNNAAGYLTEYLGQVWENGAWKNDMRISLEYDARNHFVLYLSQRWVNNAWEATNGGRATVTYSAAGAILEETEDLLDAPTNQFYPYRRVQYTYPTPASMQHSVRVEQGWRNGAYYNSQRTSNIVRDAQGRETYSEAESWENNAWQLSSRFVTTYTNDGYQGLSQNWVNNAWVNVSRYTQLFGEGQDLGFTAELWTNNAWSITDGSRTFRRFNAANDLVSQVRQNYDPNGKVYVNSMKTTFGDYQSITLG
ncbi:hypothetical protein [Hymenobacter cellulosilyticus]|uniref:Uncharacterized protein n=1 Tax=Hymenobacter cellulosilyticus TaxID=2932248 RepID=A0A8T9QFL3_9BACT|nr:hypothetical protein [Hymenobacter cellulosilyticus]UOQ74610.1 hypothetical protein MUN79_12505 [Hymenobacter cellulosilyticus]